MLKLEDVSCGYQNPKGKDKMILEHFHMHIRPGEIWCILGSNGIGKTTLFRTILGAIPALGGTLLLNGHPFSAFSRQELAREIAYVPQYHTPPFPFTVKEIVLMGRNAHIGTFGSPAGEDVQIAEEIMDRLHIRHLENQVYTQISGGERQMVLIARAMAQKPRLLMMDEPAASLDYGNQIRMLRQIRDLAAEGIAVIFTSHHPEHAFLSSARVIAIVSGDRHVIGNADDIITEHLIRDMYGIQSDILEATAPGGTSVKGILPFL